MPFSDPAVLQVEPLRLAVVTLSEATSLARFVRSNPQGVDLDQLARLNRVDPGEVISAGTRIKVVGRQQR